MVPPGTHRRTSIASQPIPLGNVLSSLFVQGWGAGRSRGNRRGSCRLTLLAQTVYKEMAAGSKPYVEPAASKTIRHIKDLPIRLLYQRVVRAAQK